MPLTEPVEWDGERPWDVERIDEEEAEEFTLGVFFSDEFAYDREDAVAALVPWLNQQEGITFAFHRDREVVYVDAGSMTVRQLEKRVAAFFRDPLSAYSDSVPVGADGVIRLEYVGGGSSKSWVGWVEGDEPVVSFGRIGLAGQERRTSCADETAARARPQKVAGEKLAKGYVRVEG